MDKKSLKIPFRIRVTERTLERIKQDTQKRIAYPKTSYPLLQSGSQVIFDSIEGFQVGSDSVNHLSDDDVIRYIEKVEKEEDHIKWFETLSEDNIKELTGISSREEALGQIRDDISLMISHLDKGKRDSNHSIEWDDYEIAVASLSSLPIESRFNKTIIATPGILIFIALAIWGWYKGWIWQLSSRIFNLFGKIKK